MVPSRVVGRYALYESLGAGGSATVWLGVEASTGSVGVPRALKRLHDSQRSSNAVARLFDEVRLAKHVSHPNVVQVIELVSDGEEMLAVMEYVHGEPLSRLKQGPVPPAIASAVAVDLLAGLGAAHTARDTDGSPLGLVHRDVTPDNILVGEDGRARLTDFGVAKAAGRLQDTKNGGVRGKLAYLAPEQIGGDVTAKTDLYAAGLVIWEMLVGQQPIQGENEAEMIARALAPNIAPPGISPELDAVVMKAISIEPADRYESAEELAAAVAAAAPPADPLVVAEWVRASAGEMLDHRARIVASMITPSSRGLVAEAAPVPSPSLWHSQKIGLALMAAVAMCVFAFFGKWVLAQPAPPPPVALPDPPPKPTEPVESTTAKPAATASTAASVATSHPVGRGQKRSPPPPPPPATKCNPPWLIDSQGIRRYDPACM